MIDRIPTGCGRDGNFATVDAGGDQMDKFAAVQLVAWIIFAVL